MIVTAVVVSACAGGLDSAVAGQGHRFPSPVVGRRAVDGLAALGLRVRPVVPIEDPHVPRGGAAIVVSGRADLVKCDFCVFVGADQKL